MGSLATNLFGGSKSTSTSLSENKAYPFLQQQLSPFIGQAQGASGLMSNLLGLGGGPAQSQAFDAWRGSTGYDFGKREGMGAITGSNAAKGLLNSGSTARALSQFGTDYASTKYGDYMNQLQGLINPGLSAANTIAGAGQVSQQQSKSTQSNGGFGGVVGSLLGK
jgi:hypothetical protein